jgi:putative ABC transport system substrate-binding protein
MRHDQRRILAATMACVVLLWGAGIAAARDERRAPPLHVGLLLSGFEPHYAKVEQAFLAGMQEAGLVEGENLTVERRYAHLEPQLMASYAKELAAMKLDAIVTGCTGSTRAVQRETGSIPIVMASVADPVGQGFVKSLARPGTNVTGRSSQSRALVPKMLELLREAVPRAERIAVLVNTLNTVHEPLWHDVLAAAAALPIKLVRVEMRGPPDMDAMLERLARSHADALLVLPDDPALYNLRARLVARAAALGLPSLFGMREFVDEGGLMSYGERFDDTYRDAAPYVAKVARGTNPAELPIEQPTHFELVINLRTAAALGLTIPRAVLLRANATVR